MTKKFADENSFSSDDRHGARKKISRQRECKQAWNGIKVIRKNNRKTFLRQNFHSQAERWKYFHWMGPFWKWRGLLELSQFLGASFISSGRSVFKDDITSWRPQTNYWPNGAWSQRLDELFARSKYFLAWLICWVKSISTDMCEQLIASILLIVLLA